jgi:microcystin-dependent protein
LFATTIPCALIVFNSRGMIVDALPVLGQIEIFAFDFAPTGFAACQGQLLPIAQNQALFGLIGPRYGGNGVTDFALPKLPPVTPSGPFCFIRIGGAVPPKG